MSFNTGGFRTIAYQDQWKVNIKSLYSKQRKNLLTLNDPRLQLQKNTKRTPTVEPETREEESTGSLAATQENHGLRPFVEIKLKECFPYRRPRVNPIDRSPPPWGQLKVFIVIHLTSNRASKSSAEVFHPSKRSNAETSSPSTGIPRTTEEKPAGCGDGLSWEGPARGPRAKGESGPGPPMSGKKEAKMRAERERESILGRRRGRLIVSELPARLPSLWPRVAGGPQSPHQNEGNVRCSSDSTAVDHSSPSRPVDRLPLESTGGLPGTDRICRSNTPPA
ncbi:uncharacterized protein LOC103169601 [Ornithorhynchus anatinus]|uniref:uncharacterized protein LOC103169601 n=1 Tax=Ornithorhynchus anatinus TaxID=9258 RepID=UPI0010A86CD5|nr:uncharacterized protein LOC103169601 [Ornithorhynchus anatinus]